MCFGVGCAVSWSMWGMGCKHMGLNVHGFYGTMWEEGGCMPWGLCCIVINCQCAVCKMLEVCVWGPLTFKFDRAIQPFLKIDRRHWTILKSTRTFQN